MHQQEHSHSEPGGRAATPSSCVRGRKAHKRSKARRRKSKGGWQPTKRLTWSDAKEIDSLAQAARTAGKGFNVLVTIRAPRGIPDSDGKRLLVTKLGHIGEALKRRGQEHLGVTTFEKSPDLHAHHLLHVAPENDDVIPRFADGEVINARRADRKAVGYITKQRDWLGPEFEKEIRPFGWRWEKSGGPVPGKRWTATKSALALLERPTATDTAAPVRALVTPMPANDHAPTGAQPLLFPLLPLQLPITGDEIRRVREQHGVSQDRI